MLTSERDAVEYLRRDEMHDWYCKRRRDLSNNKDSNAAAMVHDRPFHPSAITVSPGASLVIPRSRAYGTVIRCKSRYLPGIVR